MDLASAVIKRALEEGNVDVWSRLNSDLISSTKIKAIYKEINTYFEINCALPSFKALPLILREKELLQTLALLNSIEVDEKSSILFEYLKAEYAQTLVLQRLEKYIKNTVTYESAEHTLEELQSIVLDIQDKVLDKTNNKSMQRLPLFMPKEALELFIPLGLNTEYDKNILFGPGDYIMLGGKRGSGKSVVCANLSHRNMELNKKSSMYFTIEMDTESTLHRHAAIATGIHPKKFSYKQGELTPDELTGIAHWWSSRYKNGVDDYTAFLEHRDFDRLHLSLQNKPLTIPQLDIIYDPKLTLTKIRSELSKKVKALNVGLVIIDYVNQVKRVHGGKEGQYDWMEQIEVSKALKEMAQEFGIIIVSPYQIDASGEARFSKGILDSADAAFIIDPHGEDDACISFINSKMRGEKEVSFHSEIDWDCITIGPGSKVPPEASAKKINTKKKTTEKAQDEENIRDF